MSMFAKGEFFPPVEHQDRMVLQPQDDTTAFTYLKDLKELYRGSK